MPRLFTAVEIPQTVADALAMLRGGFPARAGSIRKTII